MRSQSPGGQGATGRYAWLFALAGCLPLAGCSGASQPADAPTANQAAGASSQHQHGEWWCAEHGVPEEDCGLCNSTLAAQLKKEGDWCREHDRPDSQCFDCHPELEAKFAKRYELKYGKQPPPRVE